MRCLSISEILELHDRIISSTGGSRGILDINALESAVTQPRQTFDQTDEPSGKHDAVFVQLSAGSKEAQ